jgi:hypothetical protein
VLDGNADRFDVVVKQAAGQIDIDTGVYHWPLFPVIFWITRVAS